MVIVSSPTPIRVQRFFPRMTELAIQIRAGFTLTIAHEQGEVQNAANGGPDGLQLTQAATVTPYHFPWKGELWHIASAVGSQWTLIIVGEYDSNVTLEDADQKNSRSKLDYAPVKRC